MLSAELQLGDKFLPVISHQITGNHGSATIQVKLPSMVFKDSLFQEHKTPLWSSHIDDSNQIEDQD